jgi:hypothetical protein
MLSVVIAAETTDWPVVSTLAALVPAAAHGTVRDVILVDRHASPAMERVADVAGCHLENISGSRGAALTQGASIARGPWLMFIAPGAVLEPGWADDVTRFIEAMEHDGTMRAATFTSVPDPHEPLTVTARLRGLLHSLRTNGDGLVIRKTFYEKLRGHRPEAAHPERDLIGRIGRKNLVKLRAQIIAPPRETQPA